MQHLMQIFYYQSKFAYSNCHIEH